MIVLFGDLDCWWCDEFDSFDGCMLIVLVMLDGLLYFDVVGCMICVLSYLFSGLCVVMMVVGVVCCEWFGLLSIVFDVGCGLVFGYGLCVLCVLVVDDVVVNGLIFCE